MANIYIVPNQRFTSEVMGESNSTFLCPSNTVMTGRYHTGDENGSTQYEYATLKAIDEFGNPVAGYISVGNTVWSSYFSESSGAGFDAVNNRVIIGRQHLGDENGNTRYATAEIRFNGNIVTITAGPMSGNIVESAGVWYKTANNAVITGRHHTGDENGTTKYYSGIPMIVVEDEGDDHTSPAPAGTRIVPDVRYYSASMQESGHSFLCPNGMVMTGRQHLGDENGSTFYQYASLKAIDSNNNIVNGLITIENISWSNYVTESDGKGFDAPLNHVVVGRSHLDDEDGYTRYATGVVKFNGHPTEIHGYTVSEPRTEAGGWAPFETDSQHVIVGRHHYGDENGMTHYRLGIISCDIEPSPQDPIKVLMFMHPNEDYFPMDPMDFIKLSRFRKHIHNSSDKGYNKQLSMFLSSDSHDANYYNIPVSIIDSFHIDITTGKNLCPRHPNSLDHDEVFLQSCNVLNGDTKPTKRVPVFLHRVISGTEEHRFYWFFWGYNSASANGFDGSHQGDWETLALHIVGGKIVSAEMSQHKYTHYYYKTELELSENDTLLKLYCAKGTHALYPSAGIFPRPLPSPFSANDEASAGGYVWNVGMSVQNLDDQPWRHYAGAWGEVGLFHHSTGPLGPCELYTDELEIS